MKIKKNFVLRTIAGSNVVVPTGSDSVNFNGMISLNETGAFLWKILETGADEAILADRLQAEYEGADRQTYEKDVAAFIKVLSDANILED